MDAQDSRAEPYWLFLPTDAVFDLAELADVPHMIPTFVRRYGLLWHGGDDLLPFEGSSEKPPSLKEPLEAWFGAIAKFRSALNTYHALSESVRFGSAAPVRKMLANSAPYVEEASQRARVGELITQKDDLVLLEQTSVHLAHSLSDGMRGCEVGVVSTMELEFVPDGTTDRHPASFRLSHNPSDLLSATYERFAMLVASRAEVRECPGCSRLFPPKSGKQKYCREACASTSRWRRWKEGQADK